MRRIFTAFTAVSLAFSLVAMATPANAAVPGYDSAYAGESAFLNLNPGQPGTFTVFFANTGSTSWVRGTGTQVDLAACLENKTTCNAQDASEAPFNSGWLSTTRYATHTQTTVAPGQIGTFTYNVQVPASQAAGTYRFNGALVLASTGADIRNEGYYQDVTVGGGSGAAVLTSIVDNFGSTNGGKSSVVTGSGFVCTPSFPTAMFGTTAGTVTSCGATSLTVVSPAGAVGAVNFTVTNPGGVASNALTYTYQDTSRPTFTGVTATGNIVTVTFSEPVCRLAGSELPGGEAVTDWTVNNVSSSSVFTVVDDSIPACSPTTSPTNAVTTATLELAAPLPNGAFVETTLNVGSGLGLCAPTSTTAVCNQNILDVAGNTVLAPQSRQTTATAPETTAPTMISASGANNTTTITLRFSEPVFCGIAGEPAPGDFVLSDGTAAADPVVTGFTGCGTTQGTADNSVTLTTATPLPANTTYTITANVAANEVQDVVGNDLATGATVTFTTGAGDFTPPTLIDARLTNNAGPSTNFEESGDAFTVTFSEAMNGATTGMISVQDQDGTTADIDCSGLLTPGLNAATCSWNAAVTTLTVTLTSPLVPNAGSTPGLAIPFNITAMTNVTDTAIPGNPPNILGSSDRLVDYEP